MRGTLPILTGRCPQAWLGARPPNDSCFKVKITARIVPEHANDSAYWSCWRTHRWTPPRFWPKRSGRSNRWLLASITRNASSARMRWEPSKESSTSWSTSSVAAARRVCRRAENGAASRSMSSPRSGWSRALGIQRRTSSTRSPVSIMLTRSSSPCPREASNRNRELRSRANGPSNARSGVKPVSWRVTDGPGRSR